MEAKYEHLIPRNPKNIRREIPFAEWEGVRIDYVTGKGNLAWCARKAGINVQRVRNRAKSDGWKEQREQYFKEVNARKSIPLMAAALNPAPYEAPTPTIQPLSPDYFLAHAQCHHGNLDRIKEAINRNWKEILDEGSTITTEQRTAITRETRELILLQRKLLGIPDVAPLRRNTTEKSARPKDIDIAQLKVAP